MREETAERMRGLYEFRIRRFSARLDEDDDGAIERRLAGLPAPAPQGPRGRARRDRPAAQRGDITDDIMRRIERDLDLEDARLEI